MIAYVYVDGSYCQKINFGCTTYYVVTESARYLFYDTFYGKAYNLELVGTIRVINQLKEYFPNIEELILRTDYKPCVKVYNGEIKARKSHKMLLNALEDHDYKKVEIGYVRGHVANPDWHDLNFRKADQFARKRVKKERLLYE